MGNRKGISTLIALVLLTSSADALTFDSLTLRQECREACADEIALCVELGNRPRACRRQTLRICRQEGVEVCLSDPPSPLAMGIRVPTSVVATTVSSSAISLSWTDNSTREVGNDIERSLSSTGGFTLIAVTAADAQSYVNTGLTPATTYYYRLRTTGPKGGKSAYSAIVSARTSNAAVATTTTTYTSTTTPVAPPTTTTTIAGNQPPVANAGPDQFTQTLTSLAFSGSGSTDPNGNINSYTWNFGDGGTASGVSASHSYASAGTYTVTLTVRDSGGLSDTDTAMVSAANRPPTANAGPDKSGTPGSAVTLSGSGSDPDGSVSSYTWSAGDGATGTGTTITHAYANPGTYTATFTVRDNLGAQASDTAAVVVNATSSGGALRWSSTAGDAWDDRGRGVALDASGNIFTTGEFRGTIDLGGGPMTAYKEQYQVEMSRDIYLAKYTPAGAHLWSKRIGAHGEDGGTAIAVDANGDVLVAGFVGPNVDMGGGELPWVGGFDIVVAKYAGSDGHYLWAKLFGSVSHDYPWSLALDAAGNAFVTGEFTSTIDFGGGPLTSAGDRDVFVVKLGGTDGRHLWSRRFGAALSDVGNAVAVDASGNVLVTGSYSGTIDCGGGPLASAGGLDIFVVKYAGANGAHLWSRRYGSTSTDQGTGVAINPANGDVILTGSFVGTVDLGGGPLSTPNAASDAFLAAYTSAGAHRWSRHFGDVGGSVSVDGNGNVTMTGTFQSSADFGGGALTSAGSLDIVVAQYRGADGQHVWSRRFGGTGSDRCQAVASKTGSVVVNGYFPGTVNFGDGSRTSAGYGDIFLFSLLP
jgi:PKD repeat protein